MAEVTRQLSPLEDKIDRASNNIERLFNSNGGPPGYLQTARAEDNGRFQMIFNILDEHKQDFRSIKDFVQRHEFQEKQTAKDRTADDKRFNSKMAKWTLIVTLGLGILELIAHNLPAIKHSLLTIQPLSHTINAVPQDAKIYAKR